MCLYMRYVCVLSMTLSLCASEKVPEKVPKMRYVNGAARDELSDLGWELVEADQKQRVSAQDKIPRIYQNIPDATKLEWLQLLSGLQSEKAQAEIKKLSFSECFDSSIESRFASHVSYLHSCVQKNSPKKIFSMVISAEDFAHQSFVCVYQVMCPTPKHKQMFDSLIPVFAALNDAMDAGRHRWDKTYYESCAKATIVHIINNGLLVPYLLASLGE